MRASAGRANVDGAPHQGMASVVEEGHEPCTPTPNRCSTTRQAAPPPTRRWWSPINCNHVEGRRIQTLGSRRAAWPGQLVRWQLLSARAVAIVELNAAPFYGTLLRLPPPTHRTAWELSPQRNRAFFWRCHRNGGRVAHENHGEGSNTNASYVWPPVACVRPPEVLCGSQLVVDVVTGVLIVRSCPDTFTTGHTWMIQVAPTVRGPSKQHG